MPRVSVGSIDSGDLVWTLINMFLASLIPSIPISFLMVSYQTTERAELHHRHHHLSGIYRGGSVRLFRILKYFKPLGQQKKLTYYEQDKF